MKTVITIAGLILACAIAVPASASSKSDALTLCKIEVQGTMENVTRIRTAKIKERSGGVYVKLRVSTEDTEGSQAVKCAVEDGIVSLSNNDGNLIASKNSVVATGSE